MILEKNITKKTQKNWKKLCEEKTVSIHSVF